MISAGTMKQHLRLIFAALSLGISHAAQIPNFAPADLVLGQPNFTTATIPGAPTAASLNEPSAVALDPATGKVFVADTGNNRVLRYASATSLANGAGAEFAFGQSSLAATLSPDPPDAATMNSPTGLAFDAGGRLWVVDADNARVLMFRNAARVTTTPPPADLVLGQPNATSRAFVTSRAGLKGPEGICVDSAGRVWVADSASNRVVRYDNAANKATGADADGVLGQGNGAGRFDTSTPGHDQLGFEEPVGVTVDATGTLWVADRGNHRVMGFPSAATVSDGTNAAHVVGQLDFTTISPGTSAIKFNGPSGVFADSKNGLWVLDQGNNRALRFAGLSSLNVNAPASTVVGQPDFADNATGLDARRLDSPFLGVFTQTDGTLWLSDLNHHRVLRFAIADGGPPTIRINGKRKIKTSKARIILRGTASDDTGVTKVALKIGRKSIPALGTTSWRRTIRLKKNRTVVKAFAFDAAGNVAAPAKVLILRQQKR